MTTNRRFHRTGLQGLGLLCAVTFGACTDERTIVGPEPATSLRSLNNLSISDASIALLWVEVSGGELRQPLLYNLPVGDLEKKQSLAVPAGKGYDALVRGYDRYGEQTHEGKLALEVVEIGENGSIDLSLDPVKKGDAARVSVDLFGEEPTREELRIAIRPEKKAVHEGESIALTATLLDAEGREVRIDPSELHWAIEDPMTGRVVPAMRDDMAGAQYTVWYKSYGWVTLVAIFRQWRGNMRLTILPDAWVDVAAGGDVTCGLKDSGRLYCWGSNSWHMLGNATQDSTCGGYTCSSAPLAVEGGKRFSNVSVGKSHVCAVEQTTGAPYCWGDNLFRKLGLPAGTNFAATPTLVGGTPPAFKSIAAGWNHSCGVTTTGTAMCWGHGTYGQLGSGSGATTETPTAVSAPFGSAQVTYASVTGGMMHSCGSTTSSEIYCWGSLGGSSSSIPKAVAFQNGSGWSVLAQGGTAKHACATNAASTVFCWGDGGSGQLGNGTAGAGMKSAVPVWVRNSSSGAFTPSLVKLAVGEEHSCGLSAAGNAFCWGHNLYGQLGDGSQIQRTTPVGAGAHTYTKISAGSAHTCALDTQAEIYCWGANALGQLGIGTRATLLPYGGGQNGVATPTRVVAPI
jgi:alpha-tubulin suppressor-like RCC1 family protein